MDGNIKWLVSAGHEMASELKAECGAVDMRSVAKLISDLATQLEVQLVRANALAAENARLKSAVTQQIELRAEIKKAGRPPHADFWVQSICEAEEKVKRALEETTVTDAFLAEVRAQGVEMFAASMKVVGGHEHPYSSLAHEFADQLRKGGNQ
ncbi:TPA: hypothetical protein JRR71_002237 [Escherichia coli]|nr:hypothetical protein [Escherichia coli]HAY3763090.1 hypothetical protein [Escherichia coli]HAY3767649.1 hypothetical protein [Escherichia coli]